MHCFVVLVDGDVPVYFQVAAFPCERSVDSGFASGIAVADDLPVYFQADVASCEYYADHGFVYPLSDSDVKDDLPVHSGAASCVRSVGSGVAEFVSDAAVASEGPRFHRIVALVSQCTESILERSVDSGFAVSASDIAVGEDLPFYLQAAVASCGHSADRGLAYPLSDSTVKDDLPVHSGAVSCGRPVGSGFAEPVSDAAVASEGPKFHWIDLLAFHCTGTIVFYE